MAFRNRVRLPIKLHKPQFVEEAEEYRKANGETKVLSVVIRKVYDVLTAEFPEKIHERLKIALRHDSVLIEGDKYVGFITQEGSYDIEWSDFLSRPIAQAKFKANVTPFNASNSNCGTCEEYTQVVCVDDDLGDVPEGAVLVFEPLLNDSICCNPVTLSIVSVNSTYVDSASVNPVNNFLTLVLKDPLPEANGVILATYRAECENGLYDEANVLANVEGSIPSCLAPINLTIDDISVTTATANWDHPAPPSASYDWEIYTTSDLGTLIGSGNTTGTTVALTGLIQLTTYRFFVRGNCGGGNVSNYISIDFQTLSEDAGEFCGSYQLTNDTFALKLVSYMDCSGVNHNIVLTSFETRTICALQSSPGIPVDLTAQSGVTVTYLGLC